MGGSSSRPPWRDTFGSLRVRNFRRYVIAQAVASTAIWMQRIATDWLVFELTGSAAAVGVTTALQFGPVLVVGPLGGIVADRFRKRRLLVATQATTAVLCGTLAALTLAGVVLLWQVYLAALLLGCVAVVEQPARKVFVSELVGPKLLSNAISVNASMFHLGGLVGPAISGGLIALVGAGWSIGVNTIAACTVIGVLLSLRAAELSPSAVVSRGRGQIREALRYVRGRPTILWPLVLLGTVATFGMTLPVLLVSFADHVFHSGASGYGLYSSAAAVGALVGAIGSTRRVDLRLRTLSLAVAVFGAAFVLTSVAPLGLFMLCLAGVGFTRLLFTTASEAVVQMSSGAHIRGRVMALYSMVALGGQAVGGPLAGWLTQLLGVRPAMALAGVVLIGASAAVAWRLGRSGNLTLRVRAHRRGIRFDIEPRP